MTTKRSLMLILLCSAALSLSLVACGGEEEAEAETASSTEEEGDDTAEAEEEEAEEPAAEEGGGGGGGPCSRISACCRAYVNAMGATVPASTCDAYNNVAALQDSVCEQTIAGYRTGLSAMQKAIPSECE